MMFYEKEPYFEIEVKRNTARETAKQKRKVAGLIMARYLARRRKPGLSSKLRRYTFELKYR